jgi:hypothetical protein
MCALWRDVEAEDAEDAERWAVAARGRDRCRHREGRRPLDIC